VRCRQPAGGLQRTQRHPVGGLDVQQRTQCRQQTVLLARVDGDQRVGELRAARREAELAPVTVAADQGVVEVVRPVLQLEVGAVGRRATRFVDPDSGRPAGARPQQRGVQRAVGFDGETWHTTVEQSDRIVLERLCR